jgi:hypothetical protein
MVYTNDRLVKQLGSEDVRLAETCQRPRLDGLSRHALVDRVYTGRWVWGALSSSRESSVEGEAEGDGSE